MKKLFLIICCLLSGFLPLIAESNIPYRIVEKTDSCVYVTYEFRGAVIQDDPLFPGSQFWKIDGFGLNKVPGEPAIPSRYDMFIVPEGSSATVSIVDAHYSDIPFTLSPSRPLRIEGDTTRYIPEIKPYTGFFPAELVEMRNVKYYKGTPYVKVAVFPLQYDFEHHIARSYSTIKYKISFHSPEGGAMRKFKADFRMKVNTPLNNIALNPVQNDSQKRQVRSSSNSAIEDNKGYLILTTEKFRAAAERFADWKRTLGKRVQLLIKDSWTDSDEVKFALLDAYYITDNGSEWNGIPGFEYVLFIGKAEDVPTNEQTYYDYDNGLVPIYQWDYYSDNYYLDYNDAGLHDPYRGRILASTLSEANTIVNKIINYEKNPPSNYAFYEKGMNLAYFQDGEDPGVPRNGYEDRRFVLTSEEIKNGVEQNGINVSRLYYTPANVYPTHWNNDEFSFGGSIPAELQRPTFAWNCNYDSITTHFNDGALYVLYNGHGNATSWGNLGFSTFHVDTLTNGNKLPVVFSMTCLTGDFSVSNCFAEKMLKRANGGGVAVFANTEKSLSGWNDALAEGMFDAIWPNSGLIPTFPIPSGMSSNNISSTPTPTYELGQIMDQGLFRMEENYVVQSYYEYRLDYSKDLFHCFGDPSMRIWTDMPQNFAEPSIIRTRDSIFVQVNDGKARITFYAPSTGNVDSYVGTSIRYAAQEDSITVCLDRHNYIPYIRECNVVYLQNETLTGVQNIEAECVLAGSHVTNQKPTGDLIMDGGNITITGNSRVELHSGTKIKKGTRLTIH